MKETVADRPGAIHPVDWKTAFTTPGIRHPSRAYEQQNDDKRGSSAFNVLLQILWLLVQPAKHKYLFVADLEWYLIVPLQLRQCRVFFKDETPVGYACWAYVSEEVEERLIAGASRLQPDDWMSEERLWLVDFCAPFGGAASFIKELRENVFKGHVAKAMKMASKGNGMVAVELHKENA